LTNFLLHFKTDEVWSKLARLVSHIYLFLALKTRVVHIEGAAEEFVWGGVTHEDAWWNGL